MSPEAGARQKGYKRSWKNLLINKQLQLSFTLFMCGLAALLMCGFGVWVLYETKQATTLAQISVLGNPCPDIVVLNEPTPATAPPADSGSDAAPAPTPTPAGSDAAPAPAPAPAGTAAGSNAGSAGSNAGSGSAEPAGHRPKIVVTESEMTMVAPPPVAPPTVRDDLRQQIADHWACKLKKSSAIDHLELGRLHILLVFIGVALGLLIGLAVYSIRMTHKVAGPLFKVTLYFNKMRDGRFDKVWNLRKGDQLVDFYEHFKGAHAGVVTLENDDIARLKATIAAAEASGLGEHESVKKLRGVLARKEKALE